MRAAHPAPAPSRRHPEKNAFEWTPDKDIPHEPDAIEITQASAVPHRAVLRTGVPGTGRTPACPRNMAPAWPPTHPACPHPHLPLAGGGQLHCV